MTGGQGWKWNSITRRPKLVPQDSVGLRSVAIKLQARKDKAADAPVKLTNETQEQKSDEVSKVNDVKESKEDNSSVMETDDNGEKNISTTPETETKPKSSESEQMDSSSAVDNKSDNLNTAETIENKGDSDIKEVENKLETDLKVGEEKMDIDIESVSPVKKKTGVETQQTASVPIGDKCTFPVKDKANHFLLPDKVDVELVDVSKSLCDRTNFPYYPKITKPYAKLDLLLVRRLKQAEIENKQRSALQEQVDLKLKHKGENIDDKVFGEVWKSSKSAEKSKDDHSYEKHDEDDDVDLTDGYVCYSFMCRTKGKKHCYSPTCKQSSMDVLEQSGLIDLDDAEAEVDEENAKNKSIAMEDEDVDIEGVKEDGDSAKKSSAVDDNSETKDEINVTDSSPEKGKSSTGDPVLVEPSKDALNSSTEQSPTDKSPNLAHVLTKTISEMASPNSKAVVARLLNNKPQLKAYAQAQNVLQQAIQKMTIEELKSRIPPPRSSKNPIKLCKYARFGGQKQIAKKKSTLPSCHKFRSPSGRKSIFVLDKFELKKMARRRGQIESKAFNYNCKMNNVNWIYPCPRPLFKTAWCYRTQTVKSYGGVALQLHSMWATLRWDDLAVKPPAGGTNTISTEAEITTKELLKRRDVGPTGLRSEFLVRKIVVPFGLPNKPQGNICIFKRKIIIIVVLSFNEACS